MDTPVEPDPWFPQEDRVRLRLGLAEFLEQHCRLTKLDPSGEEVVLYEIGIQEYLGMRFLLADMFDPKNDLGHQIMVENTTYLGHYRGQPVFLNIPFLEYLR